jgi:hypothetical protein
MNESWPYSSDDFLGDLLVKRGESSSIEDKPGAVPHAECHMLVGFFAAPHGKVRLEIDNVLPFIIGQKSLLLPLQNLGEGAKREAMVRSLDEFFDVFAFVLVVALPCLALASLRRG